MAKFRDVAPLLSDNLIAVRGKKAIRVPVPDSSNDQDALLWGAILAMKRRHGGGDRNPKA